jgi:hypothetical protein
LAPGCAKKLLLPLDCGYYKADVAGGYRFRQSSSSTARQLK